MIETGHQPLVKILDECTGIPTIASSRLQRWALKLAAHTYTISFRKGVSHANEDLLSRLPAEHTEAAGPSEGRKVQKLRINSLPVTAVEVARATRADTQLSRGWPEVVSQSLRPYFLKRDSITIEQNVLLLGIRVIVPDSIRDRVLDQLHDSYPGIAQMKGIARSHVWWPDLDQNIGYVVKECQNCQLQQTTLVAATAHPLIWPQVPWYLLHIDYCGPFLEYMWLVVVDATTKWVEIIPVKEANSAQTIQALNTIFVRFGWPIQIWVKTTAQLSLLRSSVGSVSQKGFVRSFQHRSIPDQTVRQNVWCVPLNQC